MLTALDTGVSALDQFQQDINVIANNIANVNTVGFKSADVSFEDTLSETLGSNAAGSMQVGTGVMTASITNDFSTPGAITSTGVQSNLAVNGNGFFVVKDPTSGNTYVTQDGDFSIDNNGYLVTSSGMRVQGSGGDIQFPVTATSPSMTGYTIASSGVITVNMSDGTTAAPTGGSLVLQNFTNPDQLVKVGGNLYSATAAAGGLAAPVAPGTSGTGSIVSGSLEMSNVDLAGQLTDLITAQRAYEANAKIISTSDEILQDIVNLKR
jgi:flagellar hook protein FlgE